MRINTNINAMYATNNMNKNTALAGNSMQKLASGLRINKASDDAAGLAVSEKMRAQIRGMEQADRNVQDGISLVQTAEGALGEAGDIVQRMRELGVQAGNDTLSAEDRTKIHTEITQLGEELHSIALETKFNGNSLLDAEKEFIIQAGATGEESPDNGAEVRTITTVDLKGVATALLGGDIENIDVDISDGENARAFVDLADTALEAINTSRATLGAQQNRLEAISSNLTTSIENMTEAESRIRDVNIASEMTNLAKLNLLTQTSQAMVAQAKSQPDGITQLLR